MELALITVKQVVVLFILIFAGFVCVKTKAVKMEGKKAFLTTRTVIQQMETYLGDAISIENKGVYYYFLAYIKYDYYKRKCFRTTPDYVACIRQAVQCGLSRMDAEQLFDILGVTMPQEISI